MHATAAALSLDVLLRDISPEQITPVFQPIVDLFTATAIGHEVLSRGPGPHPSPSMLFARARPLGLTAELEHACHTAAFARIASFHATEQSQWFVNISPEVFCGHTADIRATAELARSHGIDPARVVLEITERDLILDHSRLERAVRAYSAEGFHIALDDFGSGSSGLVTLISCMPHVIKLDMELTRGVNVHPYKQNIVRSLVALASAVNARLIAEGVETWQELEMLVRQGVRFAQGRLLASPSATPAQLGDDLRQDVLRTMSRCNGNLDDAVSRIAVPTLCVQRSSMTCTELEARFHGDPSLDCAVVLEAERPVGIITRAHLLAQMSGRFGYSLAEHKLIDAMAKPLTLLVAEGDSVVRLATLAMERPREDLYDSVVIVKSDGTYHGTVSIRQLIMRATEIELQQARDSNPLTLLPGNRQIQTWIADASELDATLLYADLDRFKEFNDAYGFVRGDEAIRLTAQVLAAHLHELCPGANLGHIGGDDFVIVAPGAVDVDALDRLCRAFDDASRILLDVDAHVTLSVAVVSRRNLGPNAHPALLSQIAASLKKKAKERSRELGESSFVVERRVYSGR